MTVPSLHSLTAQALEAKFASKQRRYESKYNASYLHHPSPPPPRLAAPPQPPNPMFEALRAAAAHLDLPAHDEPYGPPAAARGHPVRKAMLGTAATLALCALAAGGYYAWAAQASNGGPAAVSATLASLAHRFRDLAAGQGLFDALSEKVALLRPASAPTHGAGPAISPARDDAAGSPALPARSAAEPAALAAATPAPSASPPLPSAPSDTFSSPEGRSPGPGKPAEPAAADMVKAASEASTATAQQSANLLAMVRQVGLLVRDTQAENEKLRTQVVDLIGTLQAKLADLDQRLVATTHDMRGARDEGAQLRTEMAVLADTVQASSKALEERLSLALARNSDVVASEPVKQQAEAASPASAPADDGKAGAAEATTTDASRIVHGYHVQAASFGVAVLDDAGAAPGQTGARLVSVGDQVPGVGRVTSIIPHGTSWIVQTDHGTIQ